MFSHARNLVVHGSYALSDGKGFDLVEALLRTGELIRAKGCSHNSSLWSICLVAPNEKDCLEGWVELSLSYP